ncbi:hypothetical protein [Mucisphaera calidilacus]|uniref:hypothetical protein n=1 Tax=Mucisphaera calidilacus TaxID=2527982 RepID=UPI00119EFE0C|nr:hypothetical protein [Mucisphaera calidilacus]
MMKRLDPQKKTPAIAWVSLVVVIVVFILFGVMLYFRGNSNFAVVLSVAFLFVAAASFCVAYLVIKGKPRS